jgi:hypothetical protein
MLFPNREFWNWQRQFLDWFFRAVKATICLDPKNGKLMLSSRTSFQGLQEMIICSAIAKVGFVLNAKENKFVRENRVDSTHR